MRLHARLVVVAMAVAVGTVIVFSALLRQSSTPITPLPPSVHGTPTGDAEETGGKRRNTPGPSTPPGVEERNAKRVAMQSAGIVAREPWAWIAGGIVHVACADPEARPSLMCNCAAASGIIATGSGLPVPEEDLAAAARDLTVNNNQEGPLRPNPPGEFTLRRFEYRKPRGVSGGVTFVTAFCTKGEGADRTEVMENVMTLGRRPGHRGSVFGSDGPPPLLRTDRERDPPGQRLRGAVSGTGGGLPSIAVLSIDSASSFDFENYLPRTMALLRANEVARANASASDGWNRDDPFAREGVRDPRRPFRGVDGAAAIEFPSFLPLAPSTPGNLVGLLNGCILSAAGVNDTVCLGKSFPIPRAERVVAKAAMADKDRRLAALRRGERDGWPLKGSSGAGGDSAAALRYPRVLGGDMYPYTQPASALFHSQGGMYCYAGDEGSGGRTRFDEADLCEHAPDLCPDGSIGGTAEGRSVLREVSLWDILPRYGYTTLYGEEICPHAYPWSPLVYMHEADTPSAFADLIAKYGRNSRQVDFDNLNRLAPSMFNDAPFPFLDFADYYLGDHFCVCNQDDIKAYDLFSDLCHTILFEHTFAGLRRFWGAQEGPKFAMVDFQAAHIDGDTLRKRLKKMDVYLRDLIRDLFAAEPNSVVLLYSDHGRTHAEYNRALVHGDVYIDVVLWMLASEQALSAEAVSAAVDNAAQLPIATGFDIFATILDIVMSADNDRDGGSGRWGRRGAAELHPAVPPWAWSLVHPQRGAAAEERNAEQAGVPVCMATPEGADACMEAYASKLSTGSYNERLLADRLRATGVRDAFLPSAPGVDVASTCES